MSVQKFVVENLEVAREGDLQRALRELPGVLYASVSARDRCVEVEFEDDVVTTDAMKDQARSIGCSMRLAG